MQFLTTFFTLFRYEDEIRLCSGMEYTFTELKKVSGKSGFSSGRALHQSQESLERQDGPGSAKLLASSGLSPGTTGL